MNAQQRKIKGLLKQLLLLLTIGSCFVSTLLMIANSGERHKLSYDELSQMKKLFQEASKITRFMYDSQRNRRRNVQRLDGILHDMVDVLGIHKHAKEGSPDILEPLEDPTLGKVQSVCHEEYLGTLEGYPLYETGFETANCSYAPDLGKIVTVLFNVVGYEREDAETLIMSAIKTYPGVDVIAAVANALDVTPHARLTRVPIEKSNREKDGAIWNLLIAKVYTPFVFLGMDLVYFDSDIDLRRMIRASEALKVGLVGSAIRFPHSVHIAYESEPRPELRWSQNCYQTTFKNYTLSYEAGYHQSKQECLYCSHFEGPILAKTAIFAKRKFDWHMRKARMDFLLKFHTSNQHSVVCPDVMSNLVQDFHETRKDLKVMAKKFMAFEINAPDGQNYVFEKDEVAKFCQVYDGIVLSHNCVEELQDALMYLFEACKATNSICELQEGTLLGAVKLGTILPWEKDGDIMILSDHFNQLLKYLIQNEGPGSLELKEQPSCPVEAETCSGGVAMFTTAAWSLEINGQEEATQFNPANMTKVNMGGYWFPTTRNPGLHARNRYGYEMYKHVEHWMSIGHQDGWQPYKAGGLFSHCPKPNHQACLDQYQTDGNIQFRKN